MNWKHTAYSACASLPLPGGRVHIAEDRSDPHNPFSVHLFGAPCLLDAQTRDEAAREGLTKMRDWLSAALAAVNEELTSQQQAGDVAGAHTGG